MTQQHDYQQRHDTDAIIEAARLGVELSELEVGGIYAAPQADGSIRLIDLATSEYLERAGLPPVRKTGHYTLHDTTSFVAYLGAHARPPATAIWANEAAGNLTAIIDGHEGSEDGAAGYGRHRATLNLQPTPDWVDWMGFAGRYHTQEDFAEFLEDHALTVVDPSGAQLLEVATSIHATQGAVMKSAVRLDNGQVRFAYEETTSATAGQTGQLEIPTTIAVALAPYEGSELFRVTGRFRYRIRNGSLTLGIILDRPHDTLKAAYGAVVDNVQTATGLPVYRGNAPG